MKIQEAVKNVLEAESGICKELPSWRTPADRTGEEEEK